MQQIQQHQPIPKMYCRVIAGLLVKSTNPDILKPTPKEIRDEIERKKQLEEERLQRLEDEKKIIIAEKKRLKKLKSEIENPIFTRRAKLSLI